MPGLLTAIRRTSLIVSGVVSLVTALLLAERIIRPGVIEEFGTFALVGLLMLFLLPAATVLALRHDRRQALVEIGRERAAAAARLILETERTAELGADAIAEHTALQDQRAVRHLAHSRSAGRTAEGPGMAHAGDRSRTHESV